ncbi:MAG: hypothetical protein AAGG07_01560 [Planctomycetota bacterium]
MSALRRWAGSRAGRAIGFASGLVLIVALLAWLWFAHREGLVAALDASAHAPWWMLALLVIAPAANWAATSTFFFAITRRAGPVGLGEMHAVIGAAGLLNYLPMRPGMVGRIAYHKRVNGIAVRESVRLLLLSVALSVVALLVLLGVALLSDGAGELWVYAIGSVPAVLLGLTAWMAGPATRTGAWLLASAARYADMVVWAARYQVVFAVAGAPVSPAEAVALAAVSQAATMVPISGNGLGLRELAVGVCAALLPSGGGEGTDAAAVGVTADLISRAAELCVAVPIGLVGMWVVRRNLRTARGRRRSGAQAPGTGPDLLSADDGGRLSS